ncbi:MAG: response regulator transcription factor [Deltaproteobacteria bacterium]|nr:response regulator transcription factor [Deltaproteobacteria bacterium]
MEGKLTTYLPAALSAVYSDCLDNYGATKKHNLLFQYIDTICPWGSTICFCVDKEVAHLPQAKDAAAIIVIDTKTIDSKKCSQVTKREKEVLHCLTKGMQDKEIASTLGIAEKTVHAHVRNILSKLDAKNRTEAANMAIRLKLT